MKSLIIVAFFVISYLVVVLIVDRAERFLVTFPELLVVVLAVFLSLQLCREYSRKKKIVVISSYITGVFLFGLVVYPGYLNWAMYPAARRTLPFPEISFTDDNGNGLNSSYFNGKYCVIELWITDCAPCYRNFPKMEKLNLQYIDDPDVRFYTLHFPRNMDDQVRARKIMEDYGFSFEQLYAREMRENMKTLGVSHFPLIMILDRKRNIIYKGNLCTEWYERIYRVENILRKKKKKEHDP